jgi:hypothetical protein
MKTKYPYYSMWILILSFALLSANAAKAAELNLAADNNSIFQNQHVQVSLVLDTQGDSANALQAKIIFPSNLFKLEKINDGNSAVSLWIHPPQESTPGEIDLAGIIPGGFIGSSGELFSFVLQPIGTGTGTIEISTSTVLANDGKGTPLPVETSDISLLVNPSKSSSAFSEPSNDLTAPNPFTPRIESDPHIFNGQYFLIFNTTDNSSGIDHYEVLEVPNGASEKPFSSWHIATSPYLLTDQTLSSDIYVRAVDHAGNFIVVKIPARYPRSGAPSAYLSLIVIIIAVLLLLLWIRRRKANT